MCMERDVLGFGCVFDFVVVVVSLRRYSELLTNRDLANRSGRAPFDGFVERDARGEEYPTL